MARAQPSGENKTRSRDQSAENAEKKPSFISSAFSALFSFKRPRPAANTCATKALGENGERAACRLLKKARLKILARNYRCPSGEIDIIALDRSTRKTASAETIVFVEVKTRAAKTPAGPEAAVDARKRSRIKKAAGYYLRHYPTAGYRTRYDIVAVVIEPGQPPRLRHIPGAF